MPPNPSALTIVSSISFHYVEGGATPSDALLWKRGKSVCVYTHTIKIPAPMRSSDWLQGVTAQLTRVKGRQAGRQASGQWEKREAETEEARVSSPIVRGLA